MMTHFLMLRERPAKIKATSFTGQDLLIDSQVEVYLDFGTNVRKMVKVHLDQNKTESTLSLKKESS